MTDRLTAMMSGYHGQRRDSTWLWVLVAVCLGLLWLVKTNAPWIDALAGR